MSSSDEEFELNYGLDDTEEDFDQVVQNLQEEYDQQLDSEKYQEPIEVPKYDKNPKFINSENEKEDKEGDENEDADLEDLINLIQEEDEEDSDEKQNNDKKTDSNVDSSKLERKKFIIKKDNKLIKQKAMDEKEEIDSNSTEKDTKSSILLSKTNQNDELTFREKNTGLRIIKSTYKSESDLNIHLACDYGKFYKLSDLNRRMTEIKESKDMDWFSIFVIGSKTESKCSAKGNNYVIWQIFDLNNLERQQEISLFLFGGAYKSHWKSSEFDCFALIKPEFLDSNNNKGANPNPNQNSYYNSNAPLVSAGKKGQKSNWNNFASKKVGQNLKLSLSVKSDTQLVRLGIAKDISNCQSYIKPNPNQQIQEATKKCKNLVNLEQAPFCVYHCVQMDKNNKGKFSMDKPKFNRLEGMSFNSSEFKFIPPNREIASFGGLSMNKYSDLEHKAKAAKEIKSEILRSLNSSITKESPLLQNVLYKTNKKSDAELLASFDGKQLDNEELKKIRLAEQATVRHQNGQTNEASKEIKKLFSSKLLLPNENNITSISSQKLVDLKKSNSLSAPNSPGILSHLTNSTRVKQKIDDNKKNFSLSTMSSHKDILKEVKEKKKEESSNVDDNKEITVDLNETNENKDENKVLASDFLKKRIDEIKKFNQISKKVVEKPVIKPVKIDSGFDLELFIGDSLTSKKLMDVNSKYIPHSPSTATSAAYKRKLDEMSPSSGKKDDKSSKDNLEDKKEKRLKLIEELKGIKSNHVKEANDPDKNPHVRAYYNKLDQEDRLDEKLCSMRNREVRVVTCKICSYTSFTQSDFCKLKKHEIKRHMVLQRYFKCKSCGKRTYTLDKICPVSACTQCGSEKYEPCTMKDDNSKDIIVNKCSKLDEESEMYLNNENND